MNENIRKIVAANVVALRGAETQQALALRAGVSQRVISNLERAVQSPTLDTLDKLASAFRVPTWALMIQFDDIAVLRSTGLARIVSTYAKLGEQGRQQVERVADAENRYLGREKDNGVT